MSKKNEKNDFKKQATELFAKYIDECESEPIPIILYLCKAMDTNVLETAINSILNPDFHCTVNRDPFRRGNPIYSFIDFIPKKFTQRIPGGKEACLLHIGERLHQLHMGNTSILVFDLDHTIACNHNFTVKTFEGPVKKCIPRFSSQSICSQAASHIFFTTFWSAVQAEPFQVSNI